MKSACRAAALGAMLTGGMLAGRGDDAKPVTLAPVEPSTIQEPPHIVAPPLIDPNTPTEMQDNPEEAVAQVAAMRQEYLQQVAAFNLEAAARKQAYDNDWMLRGYNAEMARQGVGTAADRRAAAAEEVPDPSAPRKDDDSLEPSATEVNNSPERRPPSDSRTDSNTPASDVPAPLFLPPLLPAIGDSSSRKLVTRLDAWGSTTTLEAVPPPVLNSPFLSSHGNQDNNPDTETSLDVPGLTAERQGLGDMNDPAVSDQQMEAITENAGNRAHRDFLLPTVAGNDSTEFFKRQSEVLSPPNAMTMLHPPTATAAGNIPLGPPPAPPAPSTRMPVPTGIRSHIDDPFDLIGGHRD